MRRPGEAPASGSRAYCVCVSPVPCSWAGCSAASTAGGAPLASDLPESFRAAVTQEQGHGPGPLGAKGMGEAGMLPVAAAIANAIEDAVGARVASLPLSPEKVLAAIEAKRAQAEDK